MINVKYMGLVKLRIRIEGDEIHYTREVDRIHKLLKVISNKYPDKLTYEELKSSKILINDEDIVHLKGLRTRVDDGDRIHILTVMGGG